MIQIALVGETPVVVEEGIRKNVPEKLYILHTKNEDRFKFANDAKKLKKKIETKNKIPTELVQVEAYDMEDVIQKILKIISNEKKKSKRFLDRKDFAINITGGTKAMVAAASTACYLAGARLYYVLNPNVATGNDMVIELPVPSIPRDDSRGSTTQTTSIVLQTISKTEKTNNVLLIEKLQKIKEVKKMTPQKLQYHLKKLEANNLITISRGWTTGRVSKNSLTGESIPPKINQKLTTIQITTAGEFYAEFPDLVGDIA
tara:strand:+ start:134 stop:910 length:777 start_codon:yes stop_codon:yes gene_type:complete